MNFVWSLALCAIGALSGCGSQSHDSSSADVLSRQFSAVFPYDPLVYHLDLSILAYHLHSQTFIWPIDPFYEEVPGGEFGRREFMAKVRGWARAVGKKQSQSAPLLGGYRGPGRLAAFDDNPRHDPILYRYSGLSPWTPAIANTGTRWVEYVPSPPITDNIGDVFSCYRQNGLVPSVATVGHVASRNRGSDVLLAFEGETGDKGQTGHPASQSILGFVLLRHRPLGDGYDIHIVFRGSRSGSLLRAVAQANWDDSAAGNPDWITDLGYRLVGPEKASQISTVGSVHRGFARSLELTLPNAFACLSKAANLKQGQAPVNIFVTGHSLGGGLAQQFASAVLMGSDYGPAGSGPKMLGQLRNWPWTKLKLITYSAPRAGDPSWAKSLTVGGLSSDFHARDLLRYDYSALTPNDPSIAARLADSARPAGYRVLVSTDAVSTSAAPGRKPVGKTVYVDKLRPFAIFAPYSAESHDPSVLRSLMIASLPEPTAPPATWRYRKFRERSSPLVRETEPEPELHAQRFAEFLDYHQEHATGIDMTAYKRDYRVFTRLLAQ